MDGEHPALEEAKRHLNHQIDLIQHQAVEAIEVTKINLLILSVLVAATQLSSEDLSGFYLAGLPLILSIVVSLLAYLRVNPTLGLNREGLYDLTEEDSVEEVLPPVYANWIDENYKKSTWNHRFILASLTLTALSLGTITDLIIFR